MIKIHHDISQTCMMFLNLSQGSNWMQMFDNMKMQGPTTTSIKIYQHLSTSINIYQHLSTRAATFKNHENPLPGHISASLLCFQVMFIANDWQSGLLPVYMVHRHRAFGNYNDARCMYVCNLRSDEHTVNTVKK